MAKTIDRRQELTNQEHAEFVAAQNRKKELLQLYRDQNKVPIHISPMYRPYMGNVMIMTINGITISVPVDGTTHTVPETFAEAIEERRIKIDNMIKKTDNMSDITHNYESTPGELEMF